MLSPVMPIRTNRLGSRHQEIMDPVDDITHCPDALEFLGRDAPPGQLLQLHHQIDRVDAVEVEVLVQPRVAVHPLRRDFEQLLQILLEALVDLVLGHLRLYYFSRPVRTKAVRLRTLAKCFFSSSLGPSILTPNALRRATPISSASMESRPRPSPNSGSSTLISAGVTPSRFSASTISSRIRSSRSTVCKSLIVEALKAAHQGPRSD